MTHNAGFEPNEMYETRQVMLAQGKRIAALEEAMTIIRKYIEKQAEVDLVTADMLDDLNAQINGLTKRYEYHRHDTDDRASMTSRSWENETR